MTITPEARTRAAWGELPRPKIQLLEWTPVGKGALVGRAKIWLLPGLEIRDVAVFEKGGQRWAQFPSEAMRDRDGQPLTDDNGRIRYRTSIRWANRELQDGFSAAVVELVLAAHPSAFVGALP